MKDKFNTLFNIKPSGKKLDDIFREHIEEATFVFADEFYSYHVLKHLQTVGL